MNHKKVISLICLVSVYAQATYQRPSGKDLVAAVVPVAVYEIGARRINSNKPMTRLSRVAEVSSALTAVLAVRAYEHGNSKTAALWGFTSVGTTGMGLWCRYKANRKNNAPQRDSSSNTGGASSGSITSEAGRPVAQQHQHQPYGGDSSQLEQ